MGRNNALTPFEEAEIIKLLKAKQLSYGKIAERVGRSEGAVKTLNAKHNIRNGKISSAVGWSARPDFEEKQQQIIRLLKGDLSLVEIAEIVGRTPALISQVNRKHEIRPIYHNRGSKDDLSDKEKADAVQLFKEGHTLKSIAQNLKTTPHFIKQVLAEKLPNWQNVTEKQAEEAGIKHQALPSPGAACMPKRITTSRNVYINGESPDLNRCSFPVVLCNGNNELPKELKDYLKKQGHDLPQKGEVYHHWCNAPRADGHSYCMTHVLRTRVPFKKKVAKQMEA